MQSLPPMHGCPSANNAGSQPSQTPSHAYGLQQQVLKLQAAWLEMRMWGPLV